MQSAVFFQIGYTINTDDIIHGRSVRLVTVIRLLSCLVVNRNKMNKINAKDKVHRLSGQRRHVTAFRLLS